MIVILIERERAWGGGRTFLEDFKTSNIVAADDDGEYPRVVIGAGNSEHWMLFRRVDAALDYIQPPNIYVIYQPTGTTAKLTAVVANTNILPWSCKRRQ